ncbi:endo-1,4-beta-xylanase [Sphingomonas sp. So64.6b]|uniref:endo-1,4-beta-xylanase n=1 Tax=Sphingomonas sp. So64.6b TaxID=2997354 RepID=UPI0016031C9A|nr:endo-1,4-beta-xylanase [Sphingomonas sp. So64.6b]QNA83288.1 endo-1,4-beta-xylanase [Sphingomonas sp. So64.6b]
MPDDPALAATDARKAAFSRRSVLAGVAAVPLVAAVPVGSPTLQEAAGRAGMLFGAAMRANVIASDAALRTAVARECGVITPELELKWAWIEPQQGRFVFRDADRIAAFASTTGKTMHGHALLWHQSIPPWVAQVLADRPDWTIMRRFMAAVMPRYAATVRTWDVVNEPMEMGHRMDGLRPSPFLQAFGPDYIHRALDEARQAAPRATLFINEYGLSHDLPWQRDKRYLLLKLLEGLKRAGAPVDGVGIQAHLELVDQSSFRERVLADFLDELGNLGLQVRISELDVKEADLTATVPVRDRRVADAVGAYLDVALDNRAVGSVTCWGLTDRYSWLDEGRNVGNRGLPLDRDFVPKPVYDAIRRAFERRLVND